MGLIRETFQTSKTETPPLTEIKCCIHYYLFRGTPTQIWLDHTFSETFGLEVRLSAATADLYYARISDCLSKDEFRPRALFDSFNIEVIATTEPANDPLTHHKDIANSDWTGRVITAYRPDSVVDPEFDGFLDNLAEFGEISGEDIGTWEGYLNAHRIRRAYFAAHGATSTDHGHPTAKTANLSRVEAEALYAGNCTRAPTGTTTLICLNNLDVISGLISRNAPLMSTR